MKVAVVHDYLTQRGGAERVVLAMMRAFPEATLHTSLYDPGATYPEFRDMVVETGALDRVPLLRRHHRLALPFLAGWFSTTEVDADVVLCSSSGWSHGVRATGRKIVYCHTTARWLYQSEGYITSWPARTSLVVLRPALVRWDRRASASVDRYVANSGLVRERIREQYGRDATVLVPPPGVTPAGSQRAIPGLEPGYVLSVSRLLPYKNVGAVVEAFAGWEGHRLVLVGTGPSRTSLPSVVPSNVVVLGSVSDAELRWLYAHATAIVSAAFEDLGLVPVEAATFGLPSIVLRAGGFLETVVEGRTGVFFDSPQPDAIRGAVSSLDRHRFDPELIRAHAGTFSEERFRSNLRAIVEAEVDDGVPGPSRRRSSA